MSLIEELYTPKAVQLIRDLYNDDIEYRETMYKAFGKKIIESQDKFLTAKPLDILALICNTASFADDKNECHTVAVIIYKHIQNPNPLPSLLDDKQFEFAEKTLVSLSFFNDALIHRWKRRGAPSPDFYRQCSEAIFSKNHLENIAEHHRQWESFLCEIFI